jgi:ubiquinone/menaquinone biosynthesis C-methylase UbiE
MTDIYNKHQMKLLKDYDAVWKDLLELQEYGEQVHHHELNRTRYYDVLRKNLKHLKRPISLEIGCGTGIDLNTVARENEHPICFGSDISEKSILLSLSISKAFGKKVDFFVSDTRNLPLKTNSLDLVFSQGLIEHFQDPLTIINEQVRVLKNGGTIIINVPQKYTGYTLVKKKLMKKDKWELGWETEFSYGDLKKIGRKLGLIEKQIIGYQYWKSWKEPIFVLKDLYDKLNRRNPLKNIQPFPILKRIYDSIWEELEEKWGHYFLQNIVIVFEKRIA